MTFLMILLIALAPLSQEESETLLEQARQDQGVLVSQDLINRVEVRGGSLEVEFLVTDMLNGSSGDEVELIERLARVRALAQSYRIQPKTIPAERLALPDMIYRNPKGMLSLFIGSAVLRPGSWVNPDQFVVNITSSDLILEDKSGARQFIDIDVIWPSDQNFHVLHVNDAPVDSALHFLAVQGKFGLEKAADLSAPIQGCFKGRSTLDLIDLLCKEADLGWEKEKDTLTIQRLQDDSQFKGFHINRISAKQSPAIDIFRFISDQVGMGFQDPDNLLDGVKVDLEINDEPWDKVLAKLTRVSQIKLAMTLDDDGKRMLTVQPLSTQENR